MLKALLGHWKANRRKPSLLPEDGDTHFDEPTTINPLFEDSDSSISSNRAAGANGTDGAPATDSLTDPSSAESEQRAEVGNLVDLAAPSTRNDVEAEDLGRETEVPNINEVKHVAQNPAVDIEDTDALASERSDSSELSVIDEDFEFNSPPVDEENMRIYQPPPNVPSNNQKNVSNSLVSERKQSFKRFSLGNPVKQENASDEAKPAAMLKNTANHVIPGASKFSPGLISANKEKEHPANLRARAIDELIKRFQERSNGNDESDEKVDTESASNNLDKISKHSNGVTKAEQNGSSPSTSLHQGTGASNKNSSQKESLMNIFRVPPPPPLENLKQESRLHGKILAQTSKASASPKVSPSNEVRNVPNNTGEGTTKSDSSLERIRVAPTEETNKSSSQTKREETPVSLGPTEGRSFLHSTKKKDPIRTINAKSVLPANRAQETVTRTTEVDDARQMEFKTEHSKATGSEHQSEAPNLSRTEELVPLTGTTSKTEKAKVDHSVTQKSSQLEVVVSDSPTVTNNPIFDELKDTEPKTRDAQQPAGEREVPSPSNSSQPVQVENPIAQPELETPNHQQEPKEQQPPSKDNKSPNPSHKTILKSSLSKASANATAGGDPETSKSHSEDSGITRGDQISSEATPPDAPEGQKPSPRKHRKERRPRSSCRKCKRSHGSFSSRRSRYDDYYDLLTGAAKGRRSDSFASDLSWDERDLLQRLHALRSLKGTVRSTRSRLSGRGEDGGFLAPAPCSCAECWAQYVREYAYSRASLRGTPPMYMRCTCKAPRNNVLGRRVKFVSDPILEVPLPEKLSRTSSSSGSKSDLSKADSSASADKASKRSSDLKDSGSVSQNPDKPKKKKTKLSEKEFRVMTPWELEQWDFLVRKELIRKRRKRARCMGLVALALVIFVGLVVTLLILFLKRRVL